MVHVSKRPRPKEKTSLRLAQRRRRVRLILLSLLSILALSVFFGVAYATHQSEFAIKNIEVRGTERTSSDVIKAHAESILRDGRFHLFSPHTALTYPRTRLEKGIAEQFLDIELVDASVSGLIEPSLQITVTERSPYARWCTDASLAQCYLMDSSGLIFSFLEREITLPSQAVFLDAIGSATSTERLGASYASGFFAGMRAMAETLEREGMGVAFVQEVDEHDYSIVLADGLVLKASHERSPEAMVSDMHAALASETLEGRQQLLEYIDLRFAGRMYFKLKDE